MNNFSNKSGLKTSDFIRQSFIDFFIEKGHKYLPSSPLMPKEIDSTLFTIAGMKQFAGVFLGQEKLHFKTAVTSQPCLRMGGKQNDIEMIGKTKRHCTFFEMLGNFSFFDYFKKEAIEFAVEFLKRINISFKFIYVTIHQNDDEAFCIWSKFVPIKRILRKSDNFWFMGDLGPCGPCSEIFYDTEEKDETSANIDNEERFLEIWNLVFMQFENNYGVLKPMSGGGIDTGMGLERICAIVDKTFDSYETDLLKPIVDVVNLPNKTNKRIVADHIRSIGFLINEGLIPSNVSRGYILRRLIRKCICLNVDFPTVLKTMIETMKYYPLDEEKILNIINEEIILFNNSIQKAFNLLKHEKEKHNKSYEEYIYYLYETHGLPLDISIDFLKTKNIEIHMDCIKELEKKHKITSKKIIKIDFKGMSERVEAHENSSKIICLLNEEYEETKELLGKGWIIVEKTCFYPEGGGQLGDIGTIEKEGITIQVLDTKKYEKLILHLVNTPNILKIEDLISLKINQEVRDGRTRAHSATHLICDYLWKNYGAKQCGSSVDTDEMRYDFNCENILNLSKALEDAENFVNEQIEKAIDSKICSIPLEEAKDAMFLEGHTYGQMVRVVEFPGISKQLCGGTHVKNTKDIKKFIIEKHSSIKRGIKRIKCLTGILALNYVKKI